MEQLEADRVGQFLLAEVSIKEGEDQKDLKQEPKRLQSQCRTVGEDDGEELERAWDDVSGTGLNPKAEGKHGLR